MQGKLVIIGGSYGGCQTAASARSSGYAGSIVLVSEELQLPYQRPPLSKGFLKSDVDPGSLLLRPNSFYESNTIDLCLGERISSISRRDRAIETDDGRRIVFDTLVLAVGSRAKLLGGPIDQIEGIVTLRSLDDAVRCKAMLAQARSVVIVGGGVLGLEIASAIAADKEVTVVEAQPRLLTRVAAEPVANYLENLHRSNGVNILCNTTIDRFHVNNGSVRGVRASNGRSYRADVIVLAVGVTPRTELGVAAGLSLSDGVVVNEFGETNIPGIFAVGECASHYNSYSKKWIRLESVQHALDHGKTVGAKIGGIDLPYRSLPRFWSDQYDTKMQTAGLTAGYDKVVVRGKQEDSFSVFYFRLERLIAIDSINQAGVHMLGRKLLAEHTEVSPSQAADTGFELRTLIKA